MYAQQHRTSKYLEVPGVSAVQSPGILRGLAVFAVLDNPEILRVHEVLSAVFVEIISFTPRNCEHL